MNKTHLGKWTLECQTTAPGQSARRSIANHRSLYGAGTPSDRVRDDLPVLVAHLYVASFSSQARKLLKKLSWSEAEDSGDPLKVPGISIDM
jgi:hypothetical protein